MRLMDWSGTYEGNFFHISGVNAAMAAYQSALLSAMAAHTQTFPSSLTGKKNKLSCYPTRQ